MGPDMSSSPASAASKFDDQAATKPGVAAPARSRVGRSVAIGAAILAVGAGAGFGGAYLSGMTATKAKPTEAETTEAPAAAEAIGAGAPATSGTETAVTVNSVSGTAVTNIGAFTVNLRGGAGGRVLRLEVQIETPAAEAAGLTAHSAQLRDSIITAVSDYTWSELEGAEGKTRLRDELITRVNGVLAPAAIGRLYFTQFVIQ